MSLDFINDFEKSLTKINGISGSSQPPRYWFSTGNYVLNKIISGSFYNGIPQGRITTLAGPSGTGKSFISCNIMREAQKQGAFILVLDSENALDDDFVRAIGVDPTKDYKYISVVTIAQVQKVVSSFIQGYKDQYGNDPDAPPVLIVIDSLSMLMTDNELEGYEKGVQKFDMGSRNKQLKGMLRAFVQDIKHLNITMLTTQQVYKNQDITNGEGIWIVSDAVKYSASQIILLTKLKLRDTGSREVEGIRMKCEGYKTRFTKPFQTVTIEVPYDTGMDPYNGLLDVALELGVLKKSGSWYALDDQKFQAKKAGPYMEEILKRCEQERQQFLEATIDSMYVEVLDDQVSATEKRKEKAME